MYRLLTRLIEIKAFYKINTERITADDSLIDSR